MAVLFVFEGNTLLDLRLKCVVSWFSWLRCVLCRWYVARFAVRDQREVLLLCVRHDGSRKLLLLRPCLTLSACPWIWSQARHGENWHCFTFNILLTSSHLEVTLQTFPVSLSLSANISCVSSTPPLFFFLIPPITKFRQGILGSLSLSVSCFSVCPCVQILSVWWYLLAYTVFCNQTWYGGASLWAGVSCTKL